MIEIAVLLLLAGYILYMVRRFWIAFGQVWRKLTKPRTSLNLARFFAGDGSDGDRELLWQTQLPALELLQEAGSSGVSIARMTKPYRKFARAYPELFDGSTCSDWFDALQEAGVAVHCRQGATIAITEKGQLILDALQCRCVIAGLSSRTCCGTSMDGSADRELNPEKQKFEPGETGKRCNQFL
jgi:hypothetical protein